MYTGASLLHHKHSTADGEQAASLRYLSQKFTMVTPEAKATLNDIATEECGCVCCQQKGGSLKKTESLKLSFCFCHRPPEAL